MTNLLGLILLLSTFAVMLLVSGLFNRWLDSWQEWKWARRRNRRVLSKIRTVPPMGNYWTDIDMNLRQNSEITERDRLAVKAVISALYDTKHMQDDLPMLLRPQRDQSGEIER